MQGGVSSISATMICRVMLNIRKQTYIPGPCSFSLGSDMGRFGLDGAANSAIVDDTSIRVLPNGLNFAAMEGDIEGTP